MARPRKTLTPDQVAKVRELVATGHSHAQIAKALGIDGKTFRRILKDDDRAGDAYDEGKSIEEGTLVHLLMDAARNGRETAAMFLLKTRHGYRDRGEDNVVNQGGVTVQIALPGPMQMDDWMKLVERTMVTAATPSPSLAPAPVLEGAIERA